MSRTYTICNALVQQATLDEDCSQDLGELGRGMSAVPTGTRGTESHASIRKALVYHALALALPELGRTGEDDLEERAREGALSSAAPRRALRDAELEQRGDPRHRGWPVRNAIDLARSVELRVGRFSCPVCAEVQLRLTRSAIRNATSGSGKEVASLRSIGGAGSSCGVDRKSVV